MTGFLHVNFHQRTPLNVELQLLGTLDRVEGRKTFMRGEMRSGDALTASCEALFVEPRQGIYSLENLVPE